MKRFTAWLIATTLSLSLLAQHIGYQFPPLQLAKTKPLISFLRRPSAMLVLSPANAGR